MLKVNPRGLYNKVCEKISKKKYDGKDLIMGNQKERRLTTMARGNNFIGVKDLKIE